MSGVREDGLDGALEGEVQVGVGQYDVGGLATELEREWHDTARCALHDPYARFHRSRKGDVADERMIDQRRAGVGPRSRDHVEDAVRQPGFGEDPGQPERGERSLLSRLQDHCVSGCQSRCDTPHRQAQRIIPRRNVCGDAQGLAQRIAQVLRRDGDRRAEQLVGEPRVELERLCRLDDVVSRFAQRLAVVQGLEEGKLCFALPHMARHSHQHATALCGWHACPSGESGVGRTRSEVDFRGAAARDPAQHCARSRVDHRIVFDIRARFSTADPG